MSSGIPPNSTRLDKNTSNLTFEEISLLNDRKRELKEKHHQYLAHHPELKTMLNSFMCSVLADKPTDVIEYAKEHFSTMNLNDMKCEPLVIAGPSGVGKGTIINSLLEKYKTCFGFSVSHTTRGPRPGEVDGVAYNFTTLDKMRAGIEEGAFLEHAEVHKNYYGTSKSAVEEVQRQNKICILDIDVQGAQQVRRSSVPAKFLFISPPSMDELESRLRGRGTETEEKINIRIENAVEEIEYAKGENRFDKIIVNSDLEKAIAEVEDVLAQWYPIFKDQKERITAK